MHFNYPFPGIQIGNKRGSSILWEPKQHPQAGTARRLTLRLPAGAPILRRTLLLRRPRLPSSPSILRPALSSHSRKIPGFQEPHPLSLRAAAAAAAAAGVCELGWGAQPHSRRGEWGASPWAARACCHGNARPAAGGAGVNAARSGKMASARSRGAR